MKKRKTKEYVRPPYVRPNVSIRDSQFTMNPPVVTAETAAAVLAIAKALEVAASALVKPQMGPMFKIGNDQ